KSSAPTTASAAVAATTPAIAPPPPVTPPAPAAPTTTPAAAADPVQIQIATQPVGAEVYAGAELIGPSPVELKRARSRESVTFTIRRNGFKDEKRSVVLDHDQTLEVALQAKRDKVAVRTARPQGKNQSAQQPPGQAPQHHVTDLRNPFE
ncbi:MAG TPA: PEGA domain-containing protein, partial [Polyangia bacterium]